MSTPEPDPKQTPPSQSQSPPKHQASRTREAALEKELSQLLTINNTLTTLHSTLAKISRDISHFNDSTRNTSKMMSQWSSILQGASFTLDMLDNRNWDPQNENDDDDDDDDEEDQKRDEVDDELALVQRRLQMVESDNAALERRFNNVVSEKRERWARLEDGRSKRLRELGLAGRDTRRKVGNR
ncbi:uncharacterized protein LODBEIA_P50770 [Lodderomyces beijingensis]|uniref:DASH complex subunit DUO1 n=1 Tax=Lodderomyces beijingensis TaxID=1775926 RepID=A0ABP0ZRS3_9ASCO